VTDDANRSLEIQKKFPKIAATKHIISVGRAGQGNIKLESPEELKDRITRHRRVNNLLTYMPTYVLHGLREKLTGFQLVSKFPYFMEPEGS
jgi:stress-induced morphogen